MRIWICAALLTGAAILPGQALAQQASITQAIAGTRLDITATGEVTRVPDVAVITAGVVTRSANAGAAMREAAARMSRVRSQLTAAGVADRDIQTSNISLNPDYVYENNKPPRITGYNAQNTVTVRFRNIADAGKILDALVAVGSNSINGPSFVIDKPEAALDEARAQAVAMGRARAELYARSLGLRVARVVAVTENGGGYNPPPPMPMAVARMEAQADTKIDPGEQKLQVSLTMTYELR
ncbi:MAG TPA: SIMPL domain-containing protein [Sphingomicrobium sp.]|nr:SIMPL domain-containing protein [Sphingomicrobium sp.]